MAESTIKPTTFSNGASDTLSVEDAYSSGSLTGINVDVSSTSGGLGLSDLGLPPGKISETLSDANLSSTLEASNLTLVDAIKNVQNDLPINASLNDVMKSNSLSDVLGATKRIASTLDSSQLGSLTGADTDFLIKEIGKLSDSVIIKDGALNLSNLKDASGFDYVVAAAVGVVAVKQAIDNGGKGGLLGTIASIKLPGILQDAALDSILDLAAEYGLEDVVSALFDVIGERLPSNKKKKTIEQLLRSFRYTSKPVITELTTSERSLITSSAEFFGASDSTSNLIGEIAEAIVEDKTFYTPQEQSVRFIDTLYKLDPKWNTAIRNGEVIPKLDYYRYASNDARKALASDERTTVSFLAWNSRKYKPTDWKAIARSTYPKIYL